MASARRLRKSVLLQEDETASTPERRSGGPIARIHHCHSSGRTSPMTRDTFGNMRDGTLSLGTSWGGRAEILSLRRLLEDVTDVAMVTTGFVRSGGWNVDPRGPAEALAGFHTQRGGFQTAEGKFKFWRLAAHPGGWCRCAGRGESSVGRVLGLPLQTGPWRRRIRAS